MYNHEPKEYACPFCQVVNGAYKKGDTNHSKDVFYKNSQITAFISSRKWPHGGGNVIIIPNKHYENLYDLPDNLAAKIHVLAKKVAIAMKKAYGCDGVSTRQHNEPAGNQDVLHFHFQVFPRYTNDNLYVNHRKKMPAGAAERAKYASKLKTYF